MTAIDRDPGGSTMIRVSYEVKQMIEEEKIISREPLNDCIKRGILENRNFKKEHYAIETMERMRLDFEGVTLNRAVPECHTIDTGYKEIWDNVHPEDPLKKGEVIHHINGNHNDNRPENLLKVTKSEHPKFHTELRRKDQAQKNI